MVGGERPEEALQNRDQSLQPGRRSGPCAAPERWSGLRPVQRWYYSVTPGLQGSRLMFERCLCPGMTSLLAQLFAALLVGQVLEQFDGGGLHLVVGVELVEDDDVELTA